MRNGILIELVVAIGRQGQIGYRGTLPWHISADLKNFKRLTLGHTLLMGRKTYESIGRALPGRKTLVLTRSPNSYRDLEVKGQLALVDSLDAATEWVRSQGLGRLFIVGGKQIYCQAYDDADTIYLSRIDYSGPADIYLPSLDLEGWQAHASQSHVAEGEQPAWTFTVLKRSGS